MIIQFSIANYLSFKEPATLSLAATSLRETEADANGAAFELDGVNLKLLKRSQCLRQVQPHQSIPLLQGLCIQLVQGFAVGRTDFR